LKDKGQGAGTNVGFYLDKGAKYIDLAASAVNVYNQCDVEYYMQSFSLAVSSLPGFANQVVNTYFRSKETTVYSNLSKALLSNPIDVPGASKAFGAFVKDFLMTEIPDKTTTFRYQEVGSLMQ